jgi:hypothetical protein
VIESVVLDNLAEKVGRLGGGCGVVGGVGVVGAANQGT